MDIALYLIAAALFTNTVAGMFSLFVTKRKRKKNKLRRKPEATLQRIYNALRGGQRESDRQQQYNNQLIKDSHERQIFGIDEIKKALEEIKKEVTPKFAPPGTEDPIYSLQRRLCEVQQERDHWRSKCEEAREQVSDNIAAKVAVALNEQQRKHFTPEQQEQLKQIGEAVLSKYLAACFKGVNDAN